MLRDMNCGRRRGRRRGRCGEIRGKCFFFNPNWWFDPQYRALFQNGFLPIFAVIMIVVVVLGGGGVYGGGDCGGDCCVSGVCRCGGVGHHGGGGGEGCGCKGNRALADLR